MSDTYEAQLSAARYKAERDQVRQELARLGAERDRAGQELLASREYAHDMEDENEYLRDMLNDVAWKLGIGREVHYLSGDNYAACHRAVLAAIGRLVEPSDVAQVTHSAYDLLPKEDREALRWVCGHGGLDEVRRDFQDAYNRRSELCAALGIDLDTGWSDAMAELDRRLMPSGMEWPTVDGKPVDFVTGYEPSLGVLEAVSIYSNGACEVMSHDGIINSVTEIHISAPEVPAADGEPLREGETVWEVETGDGYVVERIYSGTTEPDFPGHTVACRRPDDIVTHMFKPSQLTHERPDSWERIEEDAKSLCHDIAMYLGDYSPSDFEKSGDSVQDRVIETVRRCRALAERGE